MATAPSMIVVKPKITPMGWLALGLLLALAIVGLTALGYRLRHGLAATALGSVVPWGLWVAFYIFFIGLSAGSFLLSTLVFVFRNTRLEPVGRLAVVQAFVCLVTGLVFILIDLGHVQRFWHVIVYPQWNSVLTWEIWFYNFYIVLLLGELWLLMRCDLARWSTEASGAWRVLYRVLSLGFRCPTTPEDERACAAQTKRWLYFCGLIGIPLALGVHGGTGAIFAVVKARPAWFSPIFPIIFIVSALASGGGLLLFLRAFLFPNPTEDRRLLPTLAKLTGGFLVLDLVLLLLEFLTGLYGGMPDHVEVYTLMISGPFWYIFWFGQILLGAVIPLILIYAAPGRFSEGFRLGLAGLCIVVGVFAIRLNIVIPPLALPVFRGFDHAIDSPRLASLYVPNAVEWLSSLGIVAAAAILTFVVLRVLPIREHQPYRTSN